MIASKGNVCSSILLLLHTCKSEKYIVYMCVRQTKCIQQFLFVFTMRFLPRKAWRKPLLPLPMSPKTLQRKTLRWVCFFCRSIFLSLVTEGGVKPHTGIRGSVQTAAVHNTWLQSFTLKCCVNCPKAGVMTC